MVQQTYPVLMPSYSASQYDAASQQALEASSSSSSSSALRHSNNATTVPVAQTNSSVSNNNINNLFKQLIMPTSVLPTNQANLQQSQHHHQSHRQQHQHHPQQQLVYPNQNLYQNNLSQQNYPQQQSSSQQFNNLAQYTTLSNVNFNNSNSNLSNNHNMGLLTKNSNLLRGLNGQTGSYDNTENFKSIKTNKILNSDGDNSSKIYGNALLGSNIWDKNDAFQGEKFGPKFEYLEIDEFLNENGLNESDVEFLDQLQKTDVNNNTENIKSNTNSAQLSNLLTLSTSMSSTNSSSTSPSSSSNSSSSSSAMDSRPSSSNINLNKTVSSSSLAQSNVPAAFMNASQAVRNNPNNSSIIRPCEQTPLSFSSISKAQPNNNNKPKDSNLNENLISSTSSNGSPRASTSSRLNSFDWSVNDDAEDIDDFEDLEEYERMKKFSSDDLKMQPSLKKSKKQNDSMTMNDYSCISSYINNNNINNFDMNFSNEILMQDSDFSDSDSEDTQVSSSQNLKGTTKGNRRHQFVPNELKDDKYWARRRKNNMAAKRSRDARRMKENQIAITASYLERENELLRKQLEDSKRETKLLKAKLARYESMIPMDGAK